MADFRQRESLESLQTKLDADRELSDAYMNWAQQEGELAQVGILAEMRIMRLHKEIRRLHKEIRREQKRLKKQAKLRTPTDSEPQSGETFFPHT
jgi:hypothetical protein